MIDTSLYRPNTMFSNYSVCVFYVRELGQECNFDRYCYEIAPFRAPVQTIQGTVSFLNYIRATDYTSFLLQGLLASVVIQSDLQLQSLGVPEDWSLSVNTAYMR